jgi:hypothetical protein
VRLSWRSAESVVSIRVDGDAVKPPVDAAESGPDLLSNELDLFGRDPVYEAAVRAASS